MTTQTKSKSLPIEFKSATELMALLKAKELSSVELLELFLARIKAHNERFNIVVTLDADNAKRAAKQADEERARGHASGALHGLPMTIKDSWEVVGMTATCGMRSLASHRPARDADAIARLRSAGAIFFGKTNLPTGAADHQSYNSLFGLTRNPWNVERTVGGSSGGAAAALASGFTPLELGSDIGGSIRCPAHFNGVYGHKPSYGIVPMRGHIPPPPGALSEFELGVGGPLARSADDLELAMDLLASPQELDQTAWSLRIPASRHEKLSDFRVAIWADAKHYTIDSRCLQAIEEYAADLRRAGVKVDDKARPEIDPIESYDVYLNALIAVMAAGMPPLPDNFAPDDQNYAARFARASKLSYAEFGHFAEKREHLFRAWRRFFENYDVLLCPVMPTVAFPHDTSGIEEGGQFTRTLIVDGKPRPYLDNLQWPGLITVANLPATAVPDRPPRRWLADGTANRGAISRGPHHASVRAIGRKRIWRICSAAGFRGQMIADASARRASISLGRRFVLRDSLSIR